MADCDRNERCEEQAASGKSSKRLMLVFGAVGVTLLVGFALLAFLVVTLTTKATNSPGPASRNGLGVTTTGFAPTATPSIQTSTHTTAAACPNSSEVTCYHKNINGGKIQAAFNFVFRAYQVDPPPETIDQDNYRPLAVLAGLYADLNRTVDTRRCAGSVSINGSVVRVELRGTSTFAQFFFPHPVTDFIVPPLTNSTAHLTIPTGTGFGVLQFRIQYDSNGQPQSSIRWDREFFKLPNETMFFPILITRPVCFFNRTECFSESFTSPAPPVPTSSLIIVGNEFSQVENTGYQLRCGPP